MAAAPPVFGSRQIRAALAAFLSPRSVIVGVGNPGKDDDLFGPAVIQSLHGRCPAALLDAGLSPEIYAQKIVAMRPSSVLVLDAADLGRESLRPCGAGILPVPRPWTQGSRRRGGLVLCESEHLGGGLGTHGGSLLLLARYLEMAADVPVRFLLAQPCRACGLGRRVAYAARLILEILVDDAGENEHAGRSG